MTFFNGSPFHAIVSEMLRLEIIIALALPLIVKTTALELFVMSRVPSRRVQKLTVLP